MLAILYEWRGNAVPCVHNLDEYPHDVAVRLPPGRLTDLLHHDDSDGDGRGAHRLSLDAFGYRWFAVGGAGPAPHRRA